jgi:hypothetical protein
MAHHKRKRPANRRAGCKMCKFWKINGASKAKGAPTPDRRKKQVPIDED